jgi:hypothetical protein
MSGDAIVMVVVTLQWIHHGRQVVLGIILCRGQAHGGFARVDPFGVQVVTTVVRTTGLFRSVVLQLDVSNAQGHEYQCEASSGQDSGQ